MACRAEIHNAAGNCGRRMGAFTQIAAAQQLELATSIDHNKLAFRADGVELTIHTNRRTEEVKQVTPAVPTD